MFAFIRVFLESLNDQKRLHGKHEGLSLFCWIFETDFFIDTIDTVSACT